MQKTLGWTGSLDQSIRAAKVPRQRRLNKRSSPVTKSSRETRKPAGTEEPGAAGQLERGGATAAGTQAWICSSQAESPDQDTDGETPKERPDDITDDTSQPIPARTRREEDLQIFNHQVIAVCLSIRVQVTAAPSTYLCRHRWQRLAASVGLWGRIRCRG